MNTLSKKLFRLLILVAMALVSCCGMAQSPKLEALRNSDFVFVGTITQLGAKSFTEVPDSAKNAVVQVDSVIEKPAAATLSEGDSVTVHLRDVDNSELGARAVFYAKDWIYGKGIAVVEVSHEIITKTKSQNAFLESTRATVAQMRQEVNEADLRARINAASAVVAGEVLAVQPAPKALHPITSEHNAFWQDAVVRLTDIVKSGVDAKTIVVRFPDSRDVAWYNAPKLRPDQRAVFLLKKDEVSGLPAANVNGASIPTYTALSPLDVLPEEQLKRVQAAAEQR